MPVKSSGMLFGEGARALVAAVLLVGEDDEDEVAGQRDVLPRSQNASTSIARRPSCRARRPPDVPVDESPRTAGASSAARSW